MLSTMKSYYTKGMNENGYEVGTVINLRNLKKEKRAAPKQSKFQAITQAEVKELMAYLQALYPHVTA